jgi:hypothetical protein
MRDFMLITRPASEIVRRAAASFQTVVDEIKSSASRACPQIQWRADFDLGGSDYVEIFSAPDYSTALRVSDIARNMPGVRAEIATLKSSW